MFSVTVSLMHVSYYCGGRCFSPLILSINMFKTSENFASAVRQNKLMFKTFIKIIYKNKS